MYVFLPMSPITLVLLNFERALLLLTGCIFPVKVDPTPYYSACVSDACACDTGGDCECFCTAVAAYAEACNEDGVCVAWRTPKICRELL